VSVRLLLDSGYQGTGKLRDNCKLPDATISDLIVQSITATGRTEKLDAYEKLTSAILESAGGFRIDGFKLKSNVDA